GNANDESGNNLHCTINGAELSIDRFGNEKSSYYLDGIDDTIDIPLQNNKGASDFSISLWLNPKEILYYDHRIFSDGRGGESVNDPWIWLTFFGNGEVDYCDTRNICWNWEDINHGNHDYLCSNFQIPMGEYSHITIVREGDEKKIYLNGKLDNTQIDPSIPNYKNPKPITVGTSPDQHPEYERYYNGMIQTSM
ncbi:hypothetical protein MHK_001957, partial [Candidatus Magnetomorum sp. HK-1]